MWPQCQVEIVSSEASYHPHDGVTKVRLPVIQFRFDSDRICQSVRLAMNGLSIGVTHTGPGKLRLDEVEKYVQAVQRIRSHPVRADHLPPIELINAVQNFYRRRGSVSIDIVRETLGPLMWNGLKPFQQSAVHFCAEQGFMYLADEMGCGKTRQAVACAAYQSLTRGGLSIVVLCPSSLRNTWKYEIDQCFEGQHALYSVITLAKGSDVKKLSGLGRSDHARFIIVSYSLLGNVMAKLLPFAQMCILDESHYVKHMSSQRTKCAMKLAQQCSVRVLMSGTPFNLPDEMFSQMKIVNPLLFRHYVIKDELTNKPPNPMGYVSRYCHPEQRMMMGRLAWRYRGYDRHDELGAAMNTLMIRRRKSEIMTQLPQKHRSSIILNSMTEKKKKEIENVLSKSETDPYSYTEAFRLTCQYKIPQVVEYVSERLREKEDERVLIFVHHSIMREALEEMLEKASIPYFSIHQGTTAKQRTDYQDEFQGGDTYRVAILSIKAAGTGLTFTRANTVLFAELLFGPDDMLQAEDRAHRMGQTQEVNVIYLIQPDSTDESNWRMIRNKESKSSRVMDGEANVLQMKRGRTLDRDEEGGPPAKKPLLVLFASRR